MLGIAIVSAIAGLLLGGSIGFIVGYGEGMTRTAKFYQNEILPKYKQVAFDVLKEHFEGGE